MVVAQIVLEHGKRDLLGPGTLPDSLAQNSLNQIGELKIEGNLRI